MKKYLIIPTILTLLLFPLVHAHASTHTQENSISGHLVDGRRILEIKNTNQRVHLTVYRGDTIKFAFDASLKNPVLKIPALSIEQTLPENLSEAPYYKMKSSGTYDFSLGKVTGVITVVDYRQPSYTEVSSEKAAELIQKIDPLILDVRTPAEHRQGHLNR